MISCEPDEFVVNNLSILEVYQARLPPKLLDGIIQV